MQHNHDVDIIRNDGEYSVICVNCGETFQSKRSDAAFCGANCRVSHSRKPARKASCIEGLSQTGKSMLAIAKKYKYDDDVFKAMLELKKAIEFALGEFED